MKATIKAKLEPYLGFIHSIQYGKPSLVCDLVEPFRPYIVHFLINYTKTLKPKDFTKAYIKDSYPRYFLKHEATWELVEAINKQLFEAYIPLQRNRKHGSRMQFETLIDEYASQMSKCINATNIQVPKIEYPLYSIFKV
jgi:CRISPR/Cas system-associated endonuclease Cas1